MYEDDYMFVLSSGLKEILIIIIIYYIKIHKIRETIRHFKWFVLIAKEAMIVIDLHNSTAAGRSTS